MDASTIVAIAAALITAASLFYARRAANAARDQTKLQRQLREDAAQPYVWADLRPDSEHGQFILLVVGNSGPTFATDVRVHITPNPLAHRPDRSEAIQRALDDGITALAPGRTITWNLGVPWEVIAKGEDNVYRVTVDATGPFGPLPTVAYSVNLETLRHSLAVPPGTLHGVGVAIGKAADKLAKAADHR